MSKLIDRLHLLRAIWKSGAFIDGFRWLHGTIVSSPPQVIASTAARHPLRLRPHSSDLGVYFQIFVERPYDRLTVTTPPDMIIDAGAYTGYSSAYFLTRFPACRLVAIEPDAENFTCLQKNLLPYGGRAACLHAAVWPHPARLVMEPRSFRDGREWSRQVREAAAGENSFLQGIDLATLLSQSGSGRISILKMDIEGAEAIMFAGDVNSWLSRVDHILIELHDDSLFGRASEVFFNAVSTAEFTIEKKGELTIATRIAGGLHG